MAGFRWTGAVFDLSGGPLYVVPDAVLTQTPARLPLVSAIDMRPLTTLRHLARVQLRSDRVVAGMRAA
jgi:hypothetical protein